MLINRGAPFAEICLSAEQSTLPMADDVSDKLRQGRTNLEELVRTLPHSVLRKVQISPRGQSSTIAGPRAALTTDVAPEPSLREGVRVAHRSAALASSISEGECGGPCRAGSAACTSPMPSCRILHLHGLGGGQAPRASAPPITDAASGGGRYQSGSRQLLATHRESLHAGMTLSRGSYPMTFSRSTGRHPSTG